MSNFLWNSLSATVITTLLGTQVPVLAVETRGDQSHEPGETVTAVAAPIATELQPQTEATHAVEAAIEAAIAEPDDAAHLTVEAAHPVIHDNTAEAPHLVAYTETAIYSHQSGSATAATLYVNQIPVLTFVGDTQAEPGSPYWGFLSPEAAREALAQDHPTAAADHPVFLAASAGEHIRQLKPEQAAEISLQWDEAAAVYQVRLGEQVLLTIDQQHILPDTTQSMDQDALQVTNRLRRLVGGAEPIALPHLSRPQYRAAINPAMLSEGQRGMASWYGPGFHGRQSASGERFNQNDLTAAHRTLPFGTQVRVTNLNNGQSVVVRINDRGPFAHGRVIDLSREAASAIGMIGSGVAPVQLEVVSE